MGLPLPDGWARVPVVAQYATLDESDIAAADRYVVFVSTSGVIKVGGVVVVPRRIVARVMPDGTLEAGFTLPASDDPELSAVGWGYVVNEKFAGARAPFTIVVRYNADQVDLGTVIDEEPEPIPTNPALRLSDIGVSVASQAAVLAALSAADAAQTEATAAHGAATAAQEGVDSLTKADLGLGNVDNTADADKPVSGPQQLALDAKAPLADPSFSGVPQAPTAPLGTNSNQLATMAALAAAIANLLDSAPGALDTLNELAAALGDDPNFAATTTNALAQKQPLAAVLTNLVALARAADKLVYCTGADTVALTDFTAFARTLLDDPDAATMLATLGAIAASTKGAASGVAPLNADARLDPIYRAKKRVTVAPVAGVLTLDLATLDDAYIALSGNVSSTVVTNGPPDGYAREILLIFVQDATGGRTWAPPAGTKWPNGLAAILTATAGAVDHMALRVYNNAGSLEYTCYPVRDVR